MLGYDYVAITLYDYSTYIIPLNLIVTEVLIKISRNLKDSLQTLISFLSKRRGPISFTEILRLTTTSTFTT